MKQNCIREDNKPHYQQRTFPGTSRLPDSPYFPTCCTTYSSSHFFPLYVFLLLTCISLSVNLLLNGKRWDQPDDEKSLSLLAVTGKSPDSGPWHRACVLFSSDQ